MPLHVCEQFLGGSDIKLMLRRTHTHIHICSSAQPHIQMNMPMSQAGFLRLLRSDCSAKQLAFLTPCMYYTISRSVLNTMHALTTLHDEVTARSFLHCTAYV